MAPSATAATYPEKRDSFSCELRGGIEVSPLDTNQYRYLTLSNELKVFLVSDSSSDKAAAAVNVCVGSFNEPRHLPGLAHFLEHMIFLGTKKYPDEGSWNQAIGENSGTENAYTSNENTNYHFQIVVPPNDIKTDIPSHIPKFKEMLDRFSQFFIAPLFTASATDRELNAVDQEHQKNLQSDTIRAYYVEKALANPEHPFSRFEAGNRNTLWNDAKEAGFDTRAELLAFHEKYYISSLMNLCVAGPYSLDILEEWVTELFTPIKNSNVQHPSKLLFGIDPGLPTHKGMMIYIEPIKDIRSLDLIWFVPPTKKTYRSKPYSYISLLLMNEDPGSLLDYLKKKRKWVNSISANTDISAHTFATYYVTLYLTASGEENVNEIVELFYGYLNLLRQSGVQKWIFDEGQHLRKMGFYFREGREPYSIVRSVSEDMENVTSLHTLSGSSLYFEYNPEQIKNCLSLLVPENCNIFLVGKAWKGKCNLQEKWFGTSYGTEKVDEDMLSRWGAMEPNKALTIPGKNKFIPTNFRMIKEPLPKGVLDKEAPKLLMKNEHYELYHKLDRTFNRPRAHVNLLLKYNQARFSPKHCLLADIFAELLEDQLADLSSSTGAAGLSYSFCCYMNGFSLSVKGYNDKLEVLLSMILKRIAAFKVDAAQFERILDIEKRGYKNREKMQPYSLTSYNLKHLLIHPRWHYREYLREIESGSITVEAMEVFISEVLKRLYIVGFCGGNISEQWARTVMNDVVEVLKFKPLPCSEHTINRVSQIPVGQEFIVRMQCPNANDVNSAVELVLQIGQSGNFKRDVCIALWRSMVREPLFNELRTAQQLGYIVFSGSEYYLDVATLYFLVQSTVLDPDGLRERILKFLADFRLNVLGTMTQATLKGFVESEAQKLREPEKSLGEKMSSYWGEIRWDQFVYNRRDRLLEALDDIVLEDVIAFYDEYIAESSPSRRCLTAMVHGNKHPLPSKEAQAATEDNEVKKRAVEISDPIAFRHLCATFPVAGSSISRLNQEHPEYWR